MKTRVQKDELQKRLSDIQNIVEKKNTVPILNHCLLTAEKAGSYITATDLETAFKEPINYLKIEKEGKICVPARRLLEIIREVEGEIILESIDSQWVKIKTGKSQFRLACMDADGFPAWPPLEGIEEMELDTALLLEMIEKSLYAAGESDTRYVLNSILFHIRPGGVLTVVGTDGHRLALFSKETGFHLKEEKKLVISRKSISELRRFLPSEEPRAVKIILGRNHVLFNIGNIQFLTRLIEGTYPNYEQVIPISNPKNLLVERELLSKALRRVSIMSKERSHAVKIDINPSSMIISASSPDIGEAMDEIGIEYTGDSMAIAFNARYIIDALDVMSSERVVFRLNEPLSPVLLMEEGREDYKCVVMPMRL